ncbi:MAG: siderophore-interacting protein [Cumulibacter sp.]
MARAGRKVRPQQVLEVLESEWIAPRMIRVWIGGPNIADVEIGDKTDHYVKIWFVKPELGLQPPYDVAALRESLAPDDLPVTRTYTLAVIEPDRIAIDFVVHGDVGIAGPWAANAKPKDAVVLSGPGGAYAPDTSADWHLFAGDETAIPAIAAALRRLASRAPDAKGVVYLEVDDARDELALTAPSGVSITWLYRGSAAPGSVSVLSDAVAAHPFDSGRVSVFAHGERECMKAIRDVLKAHAVPRADLSLSGYWAYGRTEDRFQAEKLEPIGVIFEN